MFRYVLGALTAMLMSCTTSAASPVTGMWGGQQVRMTLDASGGRIEHDCGAGTIDTAVNLDSQGNFSVSGKHEEFRPGPTKADTAPVFVAVNYRGNVNQDRMALTVAIAGEKPERSFALIRGKNVKLIRCM